MTAQFRRIAVGIQDQRHRVPARQRADAVFQFHIAGRTFLIAQRDAVAIRRGRAERYTRAGITRLVYQLPEQEMDAFRAFIFQYRFKGIQPLLGFLRIIIR